MKISELPRATITQRNPSFDLSGLDIDDWHTLGPAISIYKNAKSVIFPEGEQFFIDSVRFFRDRIEDPNLRAEIRSFIGQEAMHSRVHRQYNETLARAGHDVASMTARLSKVIQEAQIKYSPLYQLALTVAFEHLTATISAQTLDPKGSLYVSGSPTMVALWRWHAVEEAEHKAVAFDVYRTVAKPGLRSYLRRCVTMFHALHIFKSLVAYNYGLMVKHAGIKDAGRSLFRFNWVQPAQLLHLLPKILAYLRPGFHPWQNDNRDHIERWKAEILPLDS